MENQKLCPTWCSVTLSSVPVSGCHLFCLLWLILSGFAVAASPGSDGTV